MSTKMRKDSTWSRLTSAQRAKLEKWLFEGNLGYAAAVARARKEFGVEGTVASMGRYYRRRAQERQPAELLEAQIAAAEVNDSPVKVENLRRARMKLIGHLALKQALERPGELEPLVRLTKLLLASEGNGVGRSEQCSLMFAYVRLCSLNGKKNIEGAARGPAPYTVSISLRTWRFSHPGRSFSRPGPNQEAVAAGNEGDFASKPIPPRNLGDGVRTDSRIHFAGHHGLDLRNCIHGASCRFSRPQGRRSLPEAFSACKV